jgi:hypothetical protein
MTVKEYLGQAYRIDQRINSKLEQVTSLRSLVTKASTPTFSDMPRSATRNIHSMENLIVKIMDMEREINADIDYLVDLKREITGVITSLKNTEYQTLLELRYLCFHAWEKIAVEMNYDLRYIHKLHQRALEYCSAFVPASGE